MLVTIVLALGTISALLMGLRLLLQAQGLAAFLLLQAALGAADLATLALRGARPKDKLDLLGPVLWMIAVVYAGSHPELGWAIVALIMAGGLAWLHRPDMILFGAATLPVLLALILVPLARGEQTSWAYVPVLVAMAGFVWWKVRAASSRRRAERPSDPSSTEQRVDHL